MPVMNGLEAASFLKKESPKVPIVMRTMFKNRFLEERAYERASALCSRRTKACREWPINACILLKPDTHKGPVVRH